MSASAKILAVNPGGTSTKVAIFDGDIQSFSWNLRHEPQELNQFAGIYEQLGWRVQTVRQLLDSNSISLTGFHAVVGRGAPLVPVPSGTFRVDDVMLTEIKEGRVSVQHASMLGAPMAAALANESMAPAFIVDPVSVDEMLPEAKLTGCVDIPRVALAHTLNLKAASRVAAKQIGRLMNELNLIVAHLGSGFTIAAEKRGRQIDHNDPTATGPMAPTRAGTLPSLGIARYCFQTPNIDYDKVQKMLVCRGGWNDHTGTDDIREIYKMIDRGDPKARLVIDATLHQLNREIGGLFAVLNGDVDALVLTGGVSCSERFVEELKQRLKWLGAPVLLVPGEREMIALADGARGVLDGEITPLNLADYLPSE
ncbi:MAG: butyrate kinase [Sedimenticola sp.]